MWHRYPWLDLSRWCTVAGELWAKWWTCLLHGAPSWKHWLVDWRAERVCRRLFRALRLPWPDWTILTPRRDVEAGKSYSEEWVQPMRGLLHRRHLPHRTDQVHRHLPHKRFGDGLDKFATSEHSDQMRQSNKHRANRPSRGVDLLRWFYISLDGRTQFLQQEVLRPQRKDRGCHWQLLVGQFSDAQHTRRRDCLGFDDQLG